MNTQTAKLDRIPGLRLSIQKIIDRPTVTEIIERATLPSSILVSSDIRFKANDGIEYYFECKPRNNTAGSVYNSLAWEVFTELNRYTEPNDDDLFYLTDADYMAYLNMYPSKWIEDVE